MSARSARPRGFTLIEIMIVVAIIGVMAALAGWNLRDQQTRSQFRSATRELTSLIREARSNVLRVGSALSTPGTVVLDASCPAFMLGTPGLALNAVTGVVTLLDRIQLAEQATCATGRCVGTNSTCLIDTDCPAMQIHTLMCRTENFTNVYRNGVEFVAADAVGSFTDAGATEIRIGFNGRGMLVTRAGAPVGRVTLRERGVASPMRHTVLVNDGGTVCIEGAAEQCARQL